jgi:hypothetical protein
MILVARLGTALPLRFRLYVRIDTRLRLIARTAQTELFDRTGVTLAHCIDAEKVRQPKASASMLLQVVMTVPACRSRQSRGAPDPALAAIIGMGF